LALAEKNNSNVSTTDQVEENMTKEAFARAIALRRRRKNSDLNK
jgi:hypothetical protein